MDIAELTQTWVQIRVGDDDQQLVSQYDREPLTVAKLVPTFALRWKLERTNCHTPDDEVLEMVDDAIATAREENPHASWTDEIIEQTRAAALWFHHENRAEFAWVMGPH